MPKTVKTTPEKEKNIFQRAFDILPEGLKNFIRTIRDVAVSITNRVIFGNRQAERLRKADVDEILRREKEEREQLGSDDKDTPKDKGKEDKKEIEKLPEAQEWLAGFAGVTDIKELSERLTEAGVPHRLVESEGQPSHIVCQNPTTEQIAQINLINAQMNEQGQFVSERTGEVIDDVAIWGKSNEGLLEFTVLNKDASQLETRYVSSAVAFEVLNEAYENSKEKSVENEQISTQLNNSLPEPNVEQEQKTEIHEELKFATEEATITEKIETATEESVLVGQKDAETVEDCEEQSQETNNSTAEQSDINTSKKDTKLEQNTQISSPQHTNELAQAEAEASAQVNTIIVYNAQAYNKALDNAKKTGRDLDIKLADTAFTVEVREGKVQGKEVQFKTKNEKSEKQFKDVIRSKSQTFIEGKENSVALAHGELQLDMKRDADFAVVTVTKGDKTKEIFLSSNESPEHLNEQIQSAIKNLDKAIDFDEPEVLASDETALSAKKTLEEMIEDAEEQANGQSDYEYVIPDETNLDDGFFDPRYS